jgi:hypothetical protein
MAETVAASTMPIVHRLGGPWIDMVQMGRYGVGFVDVEEVALGLCNHVKLAREPGGGVAGMRKFSHEIFRKRRRISVY